MLAHLNPLSNTRGVTRRRKRKLGEVLVRARLKRDLSAWKAAGEMGIGLQSLLNLESGITSGPKARHETVRAIVAFYAPDVTEEDFGR